MKFITNTVTDLNGAEAQAQVAVCECNNERFFVYQVEGQTHFHLQCSRCGVSLCPFGGACHAEEPEDNDDHPGVYHRYDLVSMPGGGISGRCETNDDNDDGYPDDKIESWPVTYQTREDALKRTGGSHIGINGCKVDVFIDGERV